MAAHRSLLLCCLALPLAAQQPAEASSAANAQRRASDNALAACERLEEQPLAFTGTCLFAAGRATFPGSGGEPIPFRGAWQHGLGLLELRQHTILTHKGRQMVAVDGGDWTLPQGDAPDLPFSPRALARHLPNATIDGAEATFLDGRPAMRVHAVWTGAAAADLLKDATHPTPAAQRILERLPKILTRQPAERTCVDAAIWFDPATRTLRAVTVRAALLAADDLPLEEDPPPAPDGLPTLRREPHLEYTVSLTMVPCAEVPFPRLDDEMRQRLAWSPPDPTPAAPTVR